MKRAFLLRVVSLLVIVTLSGFVVAREVRADVIATDGHGTFGGENIDNQWHVGATICPDGVLVQGDQYAVSTQTDKSYSLQLAGVGSADGSGNWQDTTGSQIDGTLSGTTTAHETHDNWRSPDSVGAAIPGSDDILTNEYDAPYDLQIAGAPSPTSLQSGFLVYPFSSSQSNGTNVAVRVERWDHITATPPAGYPSDILYYPSAYEDPEVGDGDSDGDGVAGTDESNFDDIKSISDTVGQTGCTSVKPIMTAASIQPTGGLQSLDNPSGTLDPNLDGNWFSGSGGARIGLSASDVSTPANSTFTTYYSVDNASCGPSNEGACSTYSGSPFNYTTDGHHTLYYFSTNAGGSEVESQVESRTFSVDAHPPTTAASGGAYTFGTWTGSAVSVTLTPNDGNGSGVAHTYFAWDPTGGCSAATYTEGTSTSVSSEGIHTLCYYSVDNLGQAETPKQKTVEIDRTPPAISITTPAAGATYALNANVPANYRCTDLLTDGVTLGSGVNFCTGNVANGSPISTAPVGNHTFTVNAQDNVGNASTPVSVSYVVAYLTKLLYDANSPVTTTQTVQIKLQVQDGQSHNLSSSSLPVTAVRVEKQGTTTTSWSTVQTLGAPFRFSTNVGTAGPGYTFAESTTTLSPGTYRLVFSIGADPTAHYAGFILVSK